MEKKYFTIKKGSKLSISSDKRRDHFKEHFAASVPQLEIPPEQAQQETFPHLEDVKVTVNKDPPTAKEMEHVLETFEYNKSAGTDKLNTVGLKYNASNQLIRVLLLLFNLIWSLQKLISFWSLVSVLTTWLHASVTCLHKKGPFIIAELITELYRSEPTLVRYWLKLSC